MKNKARAILAVSFLSLMLLLTAGPVRSLFGDMDADLARGQDKFDNMEKEFFDSQKKMEKDYKDFEKAAFEEYRRDVEAMWNDFVTSTKKDWVEYSGDKTGRSVVNFETGRVVVEVVVPKEEAQRNPDAVKERLEQELERLVVDRGKSRDYDIPVKEPPKKVAATEVPEDLGIPESLGEAEAPEKKTPTAQPPVEVIPPEPLLATPVLQGQLKTEENKPVTQENKKEFAQEIVKTKPVQETVLSTKKGEMVKATVTFPLVPDHLRIRAEMHLQRVRRNAKRFDIDVPLAFAVIHTESYFNPKAQSPVPAFGLMQLVPKSGARDAYRFVHGTDKVVSADYLFDPDNNVELGAAYLHLLEKRYFGGIKDSQNSLYCAIAAYNTGAGNLSRSLTGSTRLSGAIERINRMKPDALYEHLRTHLPYPETREYLKKVRDRMQLYQEWK